jgi:hypothetical protein
MTPLSEHGPTLDALLPREMAGGPRRSARARPRSIGGAGLVGAVDWFVYLRPKEKP